MDKYKVNNGNYEIEFELERKKVKNVNLKIKRDCSIYVSANKRVPLEYILDFVKKKSDWISKHIENFKKTKVEIVRNEYVSGEFVNYLGRQYKLKVIEASINRINLEEDYLCMYINDTNNFKIKETLINRWLKERAKDIFIDSVNEMHDKLKKFNIPNPMVKIRSMKSRWGSCIVNKNKITLNLELIKAPKSCIDYVALHELAHFKYYNHDKNFYNFLSSIMPDWKERKKQLKNIIYY